MCNTISLNWAEKLVLFDILDGYLQNEVPTPEEAELIKRIESELKRYGENHES